MPRERSMIIVAGAKKMGKSTWLANRVKKHNGNVIVYKNISNIKDKAFNFLPEKTMQNFKQGASPNDFIKCKIAGYDEDHYKEFLKWIKSGNLKNGMLIIDDTSIYEEGKLSKDLKFLGVMCRHIALDIFLVFHSLEYIPINSFAICNYLVLFNISGSFAHKAHYLPYYKRLLDGVLMAQANRQKPATEYTPVIVSLSA